MKKTDNAYNLANNGDNMDWPADKVERRKVADLIPYIRNSRVHSEAQVAQIAASIREWGWTMPILVDEVGNVIAGHGRIMAAQKLGIDDVPCMTATGWSEAKRRAYVIADNKLALNAEWDAAALGLEFADLAEVGFDLSLTGFSDDEIAAFSFDDPIEGLTDEDAVPDAPAVPVTVLGDVWLLGRHRLMCGDSTSIDAVDRLMDGRKADMVFTDPPYGMDLDTDYSKLKGTEKSPNAKGYKWDKVIGDDQDFDPRQIMAMVDYCKEQFWWGADYYFECLPRGGSLVVWQKRDKADERMIGNDFEVCWSKQRHKKHTFWKRWVGFDSVERGEKRVHPTQKPIELIEWTMGKWAAAGGIVLDLFGGSGSTLIACEKTARDCRMMELDPRYCDVIIKRWQDWSGQQATLEATGQTFAELSDEREAA